jgi:hypothetical protein
MAAIDLLRLDDRALMDLRDDFESLSRPWRELAVLAACSGDTLDSLARLSLGERDRRLLRLRRALFGRRAEGESRCEACGERLDVSFDIGELLAATRGIDEEAERQVREVDGVNDRRFVEFDASGMTVRLRAADSGDIAAAVDDPDPELTVLTRCVEQVETISDLLRDSRVREALAAKLTEIDPAAEITLSATCPHCGASCDTPFDPAGFLLSEIVAYTDRLVDEVDQLARIYGWSEADILSLGPRRRRRYLELS